MTNPALNYDRNLIRERRKAIEAPNDETIAQAAELLPPEWKRLIFFLRETGMRVGEALRARESDLNEDELTIRETKSGKARTIVLSEKAMTLRSGNTRLLAPLEDTTTPVSCKWPHFRRQMPEMPPLQAP
jgi:integrase